MIGGEGIVGGVSPEASNRREDETAGRACDVAFRKPGFDRGGLCWK